MKDQGRQQRPSGALEPAELPGARRSLPTRALWLSLAALGAATWGAFSSPEILAGYDALSWLLILIPAFLLAYYRGWRGATRVLAGGTLFVLITELVAEQLFGVAPDWILLFLVAVVLLGVGLGLGVLSELLEKSRRDALVLAYHDELTGLPNRRLLDFMLDKEFAAARRGRPLSIVLFEIDGFKAYNERHGHTAGDVALQQIAACLDAHMRHMNVGGRYGGAQFLTILSGEKVDGAWLFTDRTREGVANLVLPTGERLTVSSGISAYEPWMRERRELIDAVELALRGAKDRGGNCIVCETLDSEPIELPPDFARLPEAEQRFFERARRRQALEDAEKRYLNLFNGVPVGLYRTSPEGQILDANPALVQMLGYPDRETLLAMNAAELYADPKDRGPWQLMMGQETTVRAYEARMRRYDNRIIWTRDNARRVLGREGKVRYYQGVLEDITESKRAEEELRTANEKLRAVINAAPVAVISLDPEGMVTSWNPAAERIFGWSESQVLGRRAPFVPERKEGEFRSLIDRVLRGESVAGVEIERQRRDGLPVDLNLWAAPLYDSEGSVTGILAILVDMTEQKRGERARALLATAVEQGAEAIIIADVEGNIQYVNPAFEQITGYSRADVIGRNPRILASGKHEAAFYQEMWDTLTSGKVWAGHFINKKKDGTLYRQEGTISPVRDASGSVVNYVGVARDVTHELELEAQLQQAQKMEAVGQLAGGIAHDFNNLLTAIMANSELLLADPDLGALRREYVDEIKAAGDRAATLTRQLLAFSRRQMLKPVVLDLNGVIEGVSQMIGRLLGEHIELVKSLDPALGRVSADRGQIEQVIVNLAVNARDAMPEGGRLTIETANVDLDEEYADAHAPVQPGAFVMLAISDTGTGIDEATRARIFEPFFTTKEIGKGTGLGLSTVYGIVKQSGGYVWVYSELGQGTTFKVYLPRVDEPAESSIPDTQDSDEPPARGTETVLLVEDDEAVRAITRRTLEMSGYKILEAADAARAIELVEQHRGPIELMVTDLVMPEMGGQELAERVAALRPETRILYVSGYSDSAVVDMGLTTGEVAFLAKPFAQGSLLRKVREVLDAPRETGPE